MAETLTFDGRSGAIQGFGQRKLWETAPMKYFVDNIP